MSKISALSGLALVLAWLTVGSSHAGDHTNSNWPWIGKNADVLEIRFGGALYETGRADEA
ncbi:hypothetical protein [Oricola cellulosilytica]|uniref:hypothetical protein n=1 Tax=Oricola cellulosilytica TaxID=1429082 RepID=UPI001304B31C|nr:hypothetical protein [Oricola cellulosilytica]